MVTFRKYILFVISLFFVALGISFSVKAGLGISPVSSFAYVMAEILPQLSLGTWLFFWNVTLVVLQIVILRKRFNIINLLQIPLSVFFGFFTDFTKELIRADIVPDIYPQQLIYTLLGVISIAVGVSLALIADVILNPGEGFVKAISDVSGKKFGNIKIAVDVSFVIISAVISLIFLRKIVGVREGTLIAAVGIGLVVKVLMKVIVKPVKMIMKI